MPKTKGSLKTGGRKKGTPNKKSLELHSLLSNNGINLIEELKVLLPKLSPEKKADVLLNLMQYLYPKRKSIDLKAEEEKTESIKVHFISNNI